MRIFSITAGAAGMYCGSCYRDNVLAAELMRRGHDVTLVPVYTPTHTDEENVSRPRVLFGGISVYLQQYAPVFRWTPRFLDRIWDAPSVIKLFTGRIVSNDPRLLGELTVSMLEGERGVLKKEFAKLVDYLKEDARPDVVNIPNSLLIAMAEPLKRELGAPVCCTLQGEELFIDGLTEPYRRRALALIRAAVPTVDRFIAVSDYCEQFMSRYLGFPLSQSSMVPLGISLDGYEMREPDPTTFRVGYFARIAPEKGLHLLADAYARFRRRTPGASVRFEVAGALSPVHREYLETVKRNIAEAGLAGELTYRGQLERQAKLGFLRGLDVLSVPATYDEPKGHFLLEAMASGVPVVQPRRGAFTEIVERTGGGLLVAPDDAESLAEGLYLLWADRKRGEHMGRCGYDSVRSIYSAGFAADRLYEVYGDLVAGRTTDRDARVDRQPIPVS
jgi:glycosyltransferase involved in cell wall biosynthesis